MSDIDPAKLKVVELRAELSARGLDSKGNKPVLVERLKEALDKERLGGNEEEGEEEEVEEEEESAEEEGSEDQEEEAAEEPPEPVQTKVVTPEIVKEPEPIKASTPVKSPEPIKVVTPVKIPEPIKAPTLQTPEPAKVQPEPAKAQTPVKSPEPVKSPIVKPQEPAKTAPATSIQKPPAAAEPVVNKSEPVQVKQEKIAPMTKQEPEAKQDKPGVTSEEPMETDIKTEPKDNDSNSKHEASNLRKPDPKLLPKEDEQYPVMELSEWDDKPKIDRGEVATPERSRKRAREESPEVESPRKGLEEDEPEYDEKAIILSWYDSDLNLKVDKSNFLSATPMHEEGFAFIWSGARASYGVVAGQTFFEVKIDKHLDVSHLQNEEYPHVVRVGWSVPSASMQLGEEALSFGYGGTGKVSCNNKFRDYGKQFQEGDVVASFLDMSGDTVRISFAVNGQDVGVAFEVPIGKLNGLPLFPHVVSKNSSFTCNFGSSEPMFPLPSTYSTYVAVANLDKETQLVPGPKRPASKADCEMLMLCGLPGCGKTTWAKEHCVKHPERNYNVLGTNNLIDKMKVMGLSRRRNYSGRWEELIQQCTNCLNKLLVVAATRRRNYILDQTNVYPSAQRRKMRPFEGFVRQAIVIVPSDDELKRRCTQREQEEGKDVPDNAVMEMKGNFQLPVKGELFTEVRYEELNEERSRALVTQYNKEATDAGFGPAAPNKRPRGTWDNNRPSRFTDRTDRVDQRGSGRHGGERSDHRDRGGWGRDRGGGGGGGGGWRDNRHGGGGYRGRDGGGSWRGSNRDRDRGGDSRNYGRSDYGGGRGGGGYDRNRSRDNDRKDRWGGSQGGNWQSGNQGGGWQGGGGGWQGSQGGGWQSGQQQRGNYGQQSSYGQSTYNQGSSAGYGANAAQQSYGAYGSYGQQQTQQSYGGYGQQAYGGWNQSGYGAYQATAATGAQAQQPQQAQQSYAQYSGYQQPQQQAQQQQQSTQQSYGSSSSK